MTQLGPTSFRLPTLGDHVGAVVGVRPDKQVIWINAQANVASMADAKAVRNWTTRQFPSHAMRPKNARPDLYLSVALGGDAGAPHPAISGPVYF